MNCSIAWSIQFCYNWKKRHGHLCIVLVHWFFPVTLFSACLEIAPDDGGKWCFVISVIDSLAGYSLYCFNLLLRFNYKFPRCSLLLFQSAKASSILLKHFSVHIWSFQVCSSGDGNMITKVKGGEGHPVLLTGITLFSGQFTGKILRELTT